MVREATDLDIGALMPLLRGYCNFYKAKPSDEGLERMARALIASPQEEALLLVVEDEDSRELVGFAASGWKWSSLRGARIVVLEDLFVAEHARGRGHADALIEQTAAIARRHGAPAVTWLTAPDNRRAQAVYDRVGEHQNPSSSTSSSSPERSLSFRARLTSAFTATAARQAALLRLGGVIRGRSGSNPPVNGLGHSRHTAGYFAGDVGGERGSRRVLRRDRLPRLTHGRLRGRLVRNEVFLSRQQ